MNRMNRLRRGACAAAALILAACVSAPVKSAMQDANSVNFALDPLMEFENLSYVLFREYAFITTVDGVALRGNTGILVTPGPHMLTVQYNTGGAQTEPMPLFFTFGEGNYYYLDYEITGKNFFSYGSASFSITALTDPALLETAESALAAAVKEARAAVEKQQSFLAFSRANPDRLEGVWRGGDKTLKFTGDTVTLTSADGSALSVLVEGTFHYNENTVVVYTSKIKTAAREYERIQKFVWYYQLNGNTLDIAQGYMASLRAKGTYTRK